MSKSQVSVVYCNNYDNEKIYESVKLGINALGGIKKFVLPSEKILVKPNFLSPAEENKAITTHPSVISAVLRILWESGYSNVKIGDSPANGTCRQAISKLSLNEENLFGATIADMSEEVLVENPGGKVAKEFYFTKEVTEADAIIGVCKMKTHQLERITGAVKNMYGLICGKRKAAGHVKFPTAHKFAKMMVDIHKATPQRLHIMDGVIAMEGNGPSSGPSVPMNVILVSSDPVALDTVFCKLVYLDPNLVPTNSMGMVMGLGTDNINDIDIIYINGEGEQKQIKVETLQKELGNKDFDCMRTKDVGKSFLGLFSKLMGDTRAPYIDASKCIKCGICVEHCPVDGKGVDFKNGRTNPPVYDYKKCIRCYCCQELCPQKAIKVKSKK